MKTYIIQYIDIDDDKYKITITKYPVPLVKYNNRKNKIKTKIIIFNYCKIKRIKLYSKLSAKQIINIKFKYSIKELIYKNF